MLLVILRPWLRSFICSVLFILWTWAQVVEWNWGQRIRGCVVNILGLICWGVGEMLLENHLLFGFIWAVSHKITITANLPLFISAISLYLMRPSHLPLIQGDRLDLYSLLFLTRLNRPKGLILVSLRWIKQKFFFLETINRLQKVLSIRGVFGT